MNIYDLLQNERKDREEKKTLIDVMISNLEESQLTDVIDFISDRYITNELRSYLNHNTMPKRDSIEFRFLAISHRYQGNVIRKIMLKENISTYYLNKFIDKYNLQEVSRGAYIFPGMMIDAQFVVQQQYSKAVVSHESALYIQGLSDVIPPKTIMSVPSNYKTSQILDSNWKAYQRDDDVEILYDGNDPIQIVGNNAVLAVDKKNVETNQGNPLRITTPERSIADVLKRTQFVEEEIKVQAIKGYMQMYPKNRIKLRRVAKAQGVLEELDAYLNRYVSL